MDDQVIGPPPEIMRDVGPDALTKAIVTDLEKYTLCGGRFAIDWTSGPWKGKRLNVYCQQPGCIATGTCTGPKFVPSYPQFEHSGQLRKPDPAEMIAGAREGAKKATGKDDPRSDREIGHHIGRVWQAVVNAANGKGWSP